MHPINIISTGLATLAAITILLVMIVPTDLIIIISILALLTAELLLYGWWRTWTRPPQLKQLSLFLIIYAVISQFSNNLLYLVVVAVAFFAWQRFYVEIGEMGMDNPPQLLVLLILLRLLIRPLLGGIYLILTLWLSISYPLQLINLLTAIVLIVLNLISNRLVDHYAL